MINCSNKTDKDIVSFVSSGDIDAFYCIVEKYEIPLLKYILRITHTSLQEAENLLQEVFIKAYKNINSYNKDLSFSSWIYRIAHNITIDFYRKNKNKGTVSLQTDDPEYMSLINLFDSGVNIKQDLENKELLEQIVKIINSLDKKYREIIVLRFLEEKSYKDISDILKIPINTVATLVARAKKQFIQKSKQNNLSSYL